jgi:hypothetical protein
VKPERILFAFHELTIQNSHYRKAVSYMDPIIFYIIIGVSILLLIKFKLVFIFFAPYLRKLSQPKGLGGPGGQKYITDMKQNLVNFKPEDLNSLVDAQYDKSVNFRVAGIISDYRNDKKSLISFYGDFVFPRDDTVRYNKLLGSLKAITFKDQLEFSAENNTFKLLYNSRHIASIAASSKRIMSPDGQEIGLIEGPEYPASCNPSEIESKIRKVIIHGGEVAKYRGLFFTTEENKKVLSGKPVFESIKPDLKELEGQILIFLVLLDIYDSSAYYYQNK